MQSNLNKDQLLKHIRECFVNLVAEDKRFMWLAMVYGVAISLLTLAVPVSVQLLVNSVAHTGSKQAVFTLAFVLMLLLMGSGLFNALQVYIMELFERRVFARLSAEFTLRITNAEKLSVKDLNRHELVNRFFDIMSVQKIIPGFVIGLFALLLQMIVGVLLVSSYHPWFLIFNVCFVFVIYMIWRVWGRSALEKAVEVSAAKYRTARHLEDVARAYCLFKSSRRNQFAANKTESLVADYVGKKKEFFRFSFAQHVSFLLLYAVASAVLLGISGWLVIEQQLTLGQLVASELALSAVFYGASRLGYHLVNFYTLSAGLEEIYQIYSIKLEPPHGTCHLPDGAISLDFDNASFSSANIDVTFDIGVGAGEHVLVHPSSHQVQQGVLQSIERMSYPDSGRFLMSGIDIRDVHVQSLRDSVLVIDLATVVECTIFEYLKMHRPEATVSEMHDALEMVDLYEVVGSYPDGIHTEMSLTGLPLSPMETIRLKLAAAYLTQPKLLVLGEVFDTLSLSRRDKIMRRLCQTQEFTLLYFTNRLDLDMFDRYLYLCRDHHQWCESDEELAKYGMEMQRNVSV